MGDRDLIQSCIDRQPGSWEKFLERYSALVYHVIWKALRHDAPHVGASGVEVEDICSDVFAQIIADEFKLLRTFEWRCKFSTWLGIITYRTARQAIHRNRHFAFSLEDHNGGEGNDLLLRDIIPDRRALPPENLQLEEARRLVHEALAS
ncbi:MAG TPA: sigma-70 family RNA polymerase sigma factor, partial [Planctomycetota bacterium]|nr:sigma-70 family RNA polymerase sigma factor [Planctomycetota bacterium]